MTKVISWILVPTSCDLEELSILPVEKTKNLGFMFDHKLDLNEQINAVSQKCYLNQRNLYRIASKLSYNLKIQLVHSSILYFIDSCNSVYFSLTAKQLHSLQKIQNNAVRFIFNIQGKQKREHIMPYLKKLHFLPVHYRVKFKIALLVFKCINNIAPSYLSELIHIREIRRRESRLDDDFFLLKVPPKPQSTRTEAAFFHCGPKVWNELPPHLRAMSSLQSFKTYLKTFYFEQAFDGID